MRTANTGKPHFLPGVTASPGNSGARPSFAYASGTAVGVNGLLHWTPK
jgi:hypothetical protein